MKNFKLPKLENYEIFFNRIKFKDFCQPVPNFLNSQIFEKKKIKFRKSKIVKITKLRKQKILKFKN